MDLNLRLRKNRASSTLSFIHTQEPNRRGLTQILKVEMIVIPRPYWSYDCTDNAYRTRPLPLLVLSVGANFVLFIFVLKY